MPIRILVVIFSLCMSLLGLAGCRPQQEPLAAPSPEASPTSSEPAFQNPVLRRNFADPHLIWVDGTFYAYATNAASKNVQLATSTDLISWKVLGDAMPALAPWVKLSQSDVWAPEVMQLGDQFLLYYTARDKASGKQCVGVAVSSKPEGKFKDTSTQPLVCQVQEGGTIDAHPFRDGEELYLFFKNDGNCCGIATYIYVQKLAPDGLSLVGEPERLVRNDKPWEGIVIEAPTMVQVDGQYILFYSANNYGGFEYAVGYAVCESIVGPCEDAPENPILSSRMDELPMVVGPGHQTVLQVGDQTWLFYHAWDILPSGVRSDNRFMWMDRIEWVDGRPHILGPTTGPQPLPILSP